MNALSNLVFSTQSVRIPVQMILSLEVNLSANASNTLDILVNFAMNVNLVVAEPTMADVQSVRNLNSIVLLLPQPGVLIRNAPRVSE
jgi:uncharacterized membrane protein